MRQEIIKFFGDSDIINSVEIGLRHGIVFKNNIIYIKKLQHTQAILI